jgi:F-type H+-transporting ATPase subunit b
MEKAFLIFNDSLWAVAAAESGAGLGVLGVSWFKLLWQLIAFAILFFVFWRFVLPPLTKFLDERRQRAIEIVEGSDRIKRELANAEERTRQVVSDASKRAQEIVAQANATSERIINEASAKAQAAGAVELEKARSTIAAERDAAITELRREFADLAILAATRVVKEELSVNPQLQRRLISEVLDNRN